jgi:hypothetical protein
MNSIQIEIELTRLVLDAKKEARDGKEIVIKLSDVEKLLGKIRRSNEEKQEALIYKPLGEGEKGEL